MVSITDSAVSKFRSMLKENDAKDHGIRIFAAEGG